MMKKIVATTFCILMLCSVFALVATGIAMAAEQGYERISYHTQVTPTIDGMWTSPDEWADGEATWIGTDIVFRTTVDSDMSRWIVEFLTDTTDNAGDYWQLCIDPHADGGYVPELGKHRMFKITGHTNIVWYTGDGSGWTEVTVPTTQIEWADSLSASPTSSTPHWILEFQIDKDSGVVPIDDVWNFFLGARDASNPGLQSWPPTDPNVPDEWGIENYSPEPIPEGLTFGVMAMLSSVSVIVGYKYFVKRKETKTE